MKSSKFVEELKFPLGILKIAGLWDCENVKKKHKVLQILQHLLTCEISIFLQILYLFTTKNLVDITDLLRVLLFIVALEIKSFNLMKQRKSVVALFEEAEQLKVLVETDHENSLQALNSLMEKMKKTFLVVLGSSLMLVLIWLVVTITTNMIYPNPP